VYAYNSDSRAFTLIELLIVVAIIAILAAIAVPNFLEAQTRAKVSRVKADMRSLVTATETYRIDHNTYAVPSDEEGNQIIGALSDPWFETKTAIGITTPVAYMTTRIGDVFAKKGSISANNFHYSTLAYLRAQSGDIHAFEEYYHDLKDAVPPSSIEYFYLSYGPDADHDVEGEEDEGEEHEHEHGHGAIYDATNGTVSSGDIHYIGPGIGQL